MKNIVKVIIGMIIGGVIAGVAFYAGVFYGVNGTAKIYGEGMFKSITDLYIGETSAEYTFDCNVIDINCEPLKYTITRIK